jgi:DNA-binding response OmpR family regulator
MNREQMSERIAELEEQVAYWKSEAQGRYVEQDLAALITRFQMTPHEALILIDLLTAYPRSVQKYALMDRLPPVRSLKRVNETNNLRVHISNIRRKVSDKNVIKVVWGQGYRLGDGWKDRIKGEINDSTVHQNPTPTPHAR